jgi:hypothetical protein
MSENEDENFEEIETIPKRENSDLENSRILEEIPVEVVMADPKVYLDPTPTEVAWTRLKMKDIQTESARKALEEAVKSLQEGENKSDAAGESSASGGVVDSTKFMRVDRVASKIASKIPKFTGEGESYSWDDFLLKIQIASMNQSFDEGELKVILFQALEGNAQKYLSAHQEILDLSFVQALERLGKVYRQTKESNVSALQTLTQGPKELVHDFASRVLNTAGALRPQEPPLIKMIIEDGKRKPVANPYIKTENEVYKGKLDQLEIFIRTFFWQGLRQEIRQAMKAEDFKSYKDMEQAAIEAEKMLIAQGVKIVHTMQMKRQGKGNPLSAMEKSSTEITLKCYRCQRKGHIAKDCWSKTDYQGNAIEDSGGRGNQFQNRNQGRGRGRGRNRSVNTTRTQEGAVGFDESYVDTLSEQVKQTVIAHLKFDSRRPRSRERGSNQGQNNVDRRSCSRCKNQNCTQHNHRSNSSGGQQRSSSGNYRSNSGENRQGPGNYQNHNNGQSYRSNSGNRRYVFFTEPKNEV